MGSQELFTESKNIFLVLRYDSSKLATTRAQFCEFGCICIGNLPKIGLKKDLFFLTPLPVLDLESWFSGYD